MTYHLISYPKCRRILTDVDTCGLTQCHAILENNDLFLVHTLNYPIQSDFASLLLPFLIITENSVFDKYSKSRIWTIFWDDVWVVPALKAHSYPLPRPARNLLTLAHVYCSCATYDWPFHWLHNRKLPRRICTVWSWDELTQTQQHSEITHSGTSIVFFRTR